MEASHRSLIDTVLMSSINKIDLAIYESKIHHKFVVTWR